MYPSLYYAIKDLFGLDLPFFKMVQSFGFFVALAFIISSYYLSKELKRKEGEGLLQPLKHKVQKGLKANTNDYVFAAITGFLLGYKLLFIVLNFSKFTEDTQGFLLSTSGNFMGGLLGAAIAVYSRYRESEKNKLDKPVWVEEVIAPHQQVGNLTMVAAIAGIIGAKIFHNLENWDEFMADPIGGLISFSGLTMYGGLIVGGLSVIYYAKKQGITTVHLIDAAAPAIMIGYAIGRIGCHVSGDGDWGIYNSAYATNLQGDVFIAQYGAYQQTLETHAQYFLQHFQVDSISQVQHLPFLKPGWLNFLPDWMVAYDYPHNVNSEGMQLANCMRDKYCTHLPIPVFPTPFYETIMCGILFLVLWFIRKKIKVPGMLFSIYLVFNGMERFFIEKIRVNTLYHVNGFAFTQAELISSILFILGVVGIVYFSKKSQNERLSKTV